MVVSVLPAPLGSITILLIRRWGNANRKSSAWPGKLVIMSYSCNSYCKMKFLLEQAANTLRNLCSRSGFCPVGSGHSHILGGHGMSVCCALRDAYSPVPHTSFPVSCLWKIKRGGFLLPSSWFLIQNFPSPLVGLPCPI